MPTVVSACPCPSPSPQCAWWRAAAPSSRCGPKAQGGRDRQSLSSPAFFTRRVAGSPWETPWLGPGVHGPGSLVEASLQALEKGSWSAPSAVTGAPALGVLCRWALVVPGGRPQAVLSLHPQHSSTLSVEPALGARAQAVLATAAAAGQGCCVGDPRAVCSWVLCSGVSRPARPLPAGRSLTASGGLSGEEGWVTWSLSLGLHLRCAGWTRTLLTCREAEAMRRNWLITTVEKARLVVCFKSRARGTWWQEASVPTRARALHLNSSC